MKLWGYGMEETISLKEIFDVVRKRLKLIFLLTIGAGIVAAIISFFVLTPVYESSSQFIVNQSQENEIGYIDSGTIRTNVELINTYNVIITSNAIMNEVVEELNLPYTSETLAKNIQVSSEQNSQVVTVTVKDPSPERATNIANATVTIFQDKIPELLNVDNVQILTEAYTKADPTPVEPKPKLNIAIAIVLGLMVGVGLAFLLEYLDTSITTEEDVEKSLDIPILGVITTIQQDDLRPNQFMSKKAMGE